MTRTVFVRGWGSEREFQAAVMADLRAAGWLVYSIPDSRMASAAGWPDIVAVRDGVLLAIECKTERGRIRPEQRVWLEALGAVTEVRAMVVRPGDWPDVLEQAIGGRE